ncbi:MAG: hypothetical protein AAF432_03615 [Planctomycetota bacterium]
MSVQPYDSVVNLTCPFRTARGQVAASFVRIPSLVHSGGMGFRNGTVAYARFRLDGDPPTRLDESVLETLATNRIRPATIGAPPEVEFGWIAGRHVFDERFDPHEVAFGDRLMIGVRLDTNRVPPEIRRAYRAMAEQELAASSPTGQISRQEKRIAKETAMDRCRSELAEGRYRTSKIVPLLWDLPRRMVLAPAMTENAANALRTLFDTCFDARLEPLSAGSLASQFADQRGLNATYEDLKPSSFTAPPAAATSEEGLDPRVPVVPWSRSGPEPKDFLGNEFLLWLWHEIEEGSGLIETGPNAVAMVLDRTLELQCGWDVTGKVVVTADRACRLPEARTSIKLGKWPRKVGFVLSVDQESVEGAWQVDRCVVSGVKLPKLDDAQTPRDILEHRVDTIMAVDDTLMSVYETFLELRMSDRWPTHRGRLSSWIGQRASSTPSAKVEVMAG